MINRENIRDKLLAFYEGRTSEGEERELFVYFSTETELLEDLEKDKEMFLLLFQSGKKNEIAVPSNLEDDLNRLIDRLSENEAKNVFRHKKRRLFWVGGVAASLVLGLFFGSQHLNIFSESDRSESIAEHDTFTDPEDAYKATEGALFYASAKMNKVLERMDNSSVKNQNKE